MAGTAADFVIYHEEFFGGFSEALEQNADVFNAASNNCIQLRANRLMGEYEKESFIQNVNNLVTRRDTTSTAAAADLTMGQDEFVGVKVNRKIGPVANTLDSWRKIGEDAQTMSFALGQQIGAAAAVDMTNTAVAALAAAISNIGVGAAVYDGTAGTPTHTGLVDIMALMGDRQGDIACWVMHSKSYFDLMKDAINKSAEIIQQMAGVTVFSGTVASLGKPVVVTDTPSLVVSSTPDEYRILGLTEGAAIIDESEQQEILSDPVTGLENLVMRIQGEYAYNLKVKGCKWDTASGANPTDAAIATAANWVYSLDSAVNGIKGGPGALGRFD